MNYDELLNNLCLSGKEIKVTVINPVRKHEVYKTGRLVGFKPGLFGGGGKRFKNGWATSYNSLDQHWLKKPKVLVAYNCFIYGKRQESDWVDCDNCEFDIIYPTPTHI